MSEFTTLGLTGQAGSGKDLVADYFVEKGFMKVSFADPIKRFVMKAFGIPKYVLWGPSSARDLVFPVEDYWWFEAIGHFNYAAQELLADVLTDDTRHNGFLQLYDWFTWLRFTHRDKISARIILQTLGTEWGRKVDDAMWLRYAYKNIEYCNVKGYRYIQDEGPTFLKENYKGVVITDHRFQNEIMYTKSHGGYCLRLIRESLENKEGNVGLAGHKSEAEQKAIPDSDFDLVVRFEEGLDKVKNKLDQIYKEEAWKARSH
jgi:hypothetical protein